MVIKLIFIKLIKIDFILIFIKLIKIDFILIFVIIYLFIMYNYVFKYVIVGDGNVGKSCLLYRYISDIFVEDRDSTIGVDFAFKIININVNNQNINIKIHIWDTAGQEYFKSITRSFYRGAAGIILMYDISNQKSYENIISWYTDILEQNISIKPIIALVGNKNDILKREVSIEDGILLAKKYNFLFFESSIKLNLYHMYNYNDIKFSSSNFQHINFEVSTVTQINLQSEISSDCRSKNNIKKSDSLLKLKNLIDISTLDVEIRNNIDIIFIKMAHKIYNNFMDNKDTIYCPENYGIKQGLITDSKHKEKKKSY